MPSWIWVAPSFTSTSHLVAPSQSTSLAVSSASPDYLTPPFFEFDHAMVVSSSLDY